MMYVELFFNCVMKMCEKFVELWVGYIIIKAFGTQNVLMWCMAVGLIAFVGLSIKLRKRGK